MYQDEIKHTRTPYPSLLDFLKTKFEISSSTKIHFKIDFCRQAVKSSSSNLIFPTRFFFKNEVHMNRVTVSLLPELTSGVKNILLLLYFNETKKMYFVTKIVLTYCETKLF